MSALPGLPNTFNVAGRHRLPRERRRRRYERRHRRRERRHCNRHRRDCHLLRSRRCHD